MDKVSGYCDIVTDSKTEYVDKVSGYYDIVADCNKKLHYINWFGHDEFALVHFTDQTNIVEPQT